MNRLKNSLCYLCGAMDRVKDGGVLWRNVLTPKLKDMGVGVLNPCDKPSDYGLENQETRDLLEKLKRSGEYDKVTEYMKPICAIDLRMVDIAHFIVMSIDVDAHLCGSYHEAAVAISQKKPVVVMCKQGKKNLPTWMFGVIPHEMRLPQERQEVILLLYFLVEEILQMQK